MRADEHKPSIVNGRLLRTSPSQIVTHDLCPVKWWLDKVAKLPRKPPAASQLLGTQLHAEQEVYLGGGPKPGLLGMQGLRFLPAPGKDLLLEHPIESVCDGVPFNIAGVTLVGYIDIVNPRELPAFVEVLDHKTTSSIDKYAKTEADLWTDPQSIIYSEWAFRKFCPTGGVRFGHVYYQTKGAPRSYPVGVTFTGERLSRMWTGLEARVEKMKGLAGVADPKQITPNVEACGAYGGCDFQQACPHCPSRSFAMSLADLMNKKTKPVETPAPKTETAAPAALPPPTNTGTTVSVSECVTGQMYVVPTAADRPKEVMAVYSGKTGLWGLFRDGSSLTRVSMSEKVIPVTDSAPAMAAAVLPPDAPTPSVPAVEVVSSQKDVPLADAIAREEAAVAQETTAEAPKKRGRPKGSTNKPKDEAAPAVAVPAPVAAPAVAVPAVPAPVVEGPKLEWKVARAGFSLYINCVPSVPFTDLTGYVQALADKAAKAASVEDIRIGDGPLGFGKWKGYLAQMSRQSPPTGVCVIWHGELTDVVAEALAADAGFVVRGR